MNATVTETPVVIALNALVRADGKAGTNAFDYMLAALPLITAADDCEEEADSLIVAICDKVGARGKPTKEFPKGKANPNAIKGAGYAMTAECARLIRKVGKHYGTNEALTDVVDGTLGVVRNEALFQQALDADKRVQQALEANDETALDKATAKVRRDFLASLYGDKRCNSFAELRRQLDKATASKSETTDETATDETQETDVSAAAAVIGADDMAKALLERMGELSDATLVALFDAAKADMTRRTADEAPVAAAA